MKKNIYLSIFCLFAFLGSNAQTAVDFTANDCSGKSHTLFSELDNGKAVILFFEMGCGSCVSGAKSMETYYYKNCDTNMVKAYYLDYNSGSTCADVEGWKSTNGLTFPSFPDANNLMTPYGFGMPLIVIIGGKDHTVFYKGGWNSTKVQNAVKAATGAALEVSPIISNIGLSSLFPNPATYFSQLSFSLKTNTDVMVEVYNLLGEKVATIIRKQLSPGLQNIEINTAAFASGKYIVRLSTNEQTATLPLIIN